ncbi:MAG TPA: TIGR01458 family HAD-type hydrolase [Gammaproteobacteria bacterium]
MKAVLFDLDGVFYESNRPVPEAAAVVSWFRERHIPHLFLTNTTSRDRVALVEKLAGFDIRTDKENILTPPVAAVSWLKRNVKNDVALFVPKEIEQEFSELTCVSDYDAGDIGAVVLGDLGERWDYARLNQAFRLLMRTPQPRLIALGMTRYWKADDGLRLDVAPFVVALQHASGAEPIVMGKPSTDFYGMALSLLNAQAADTIIVGDDIRSDIDGAQQCGIRGVLVRTGKFREADLETGIRPYAILNSVADLPEWWEQRNKKI